MYLIKLKRWLPYIFHKGEISKRKMTKYLPQNPIIVEAGAHIGRDTVEMSKLWPKGVIHAFEPVSDIYKMLCENVKGHLNIRIYPIALGEKTEKRAIYVSSGSSNASSSLLKPKEHLVQHPDVFFNKTEIVHVINLVDWKIKYKIERIDFLWLDLQGSELNVLYSAKELLPAIKLIYTEVNLKENYEHAALYEDLKSFLIQMEFRIIQEKLPWKDAGNVLFINNMI